MISKDEVLAKGKKERLEYLKQPRWIGYTRAKEVLDKMDDILNHPKISRMPNLLIVGDTNNGKTTIAHRFLELKQTEQNSLDEADSIPVIYIQCPSQPEERRFYSAILHAVNIPHRTNEKPDNMCRQIERVLPVLNTKMIIIDEIHHILSGPIKKQHTFLNMLKYMGNELRIPLVAMGTRDAFNAFQTNEQLANRFEPMAIPRWKLDTDFLRLLASYQKVLPLKIPFDLTERKIATLILSMIDGKIGHLRELLIMASKKAIVSETETISIELLTSLGWQTPSTRRRLQTELLG
jgi:hypothetical protein